MIGTPTAPCGHPGVAVFGNFVNCLTKGCDGLAKLAPVAAAPIAHRCPVCKTLDTEFFDRDPFSNVELWHCMPHGHMFAPYGVDLASGDDGA